MSAVTYRDGLFPAAETKAAPRKKGLFARFLDHMIETRMQQAAREIEMYLGCLPEDLRQKYKCAQKGEQQELPFGR